MFLWTGQECRVRDDVSQLLFVGLGDTDARRGRDALGTKPVIGDVKIGIASRDVFPVIARAGDGERLAQSSRTGRQVPQEPGTVLQLEALSRAQATRLRHGAYSGKRFQRSDEHASRFACRFAGDVQAIMRAVDKVDVGVAGRSEEDCVARCLPCRGVRGEVTGAEVGFDLDDASGEPLLTAAADEHFAEQFARDAARVAGVKSATKRTQWFVCDAGHGSHSIL